MITTKLDQIEKRSNEIQTALQNPDTMKDMKKFAELSRELSSYDKVLNCYHEWKKLEESIPDLKKMAQEKDEEISLMAQDELAESQKRIAELESEIEILLVPKDPNDDKDVVMEIRGAAGGDEANIFAGDLFNMYQRYCESHGFSLSVTNAEPSDAGGYSQIEAIISGTGAYSKLKYESGVHRVQRIPTTEASGRIHTSTATVLVIPEAEETDYVLNLDEVRIDIFHSHGAGGQGVNTSFSAIRVTHLPTGTVVSCQDERSQIKNKEQALKILQSRLADRYRQEQLAQAGAERQSKIGTGDRSEKIRTYNYPQNRVTDHRIGFTINQLDRIMLGKLDPVIDALTSEEIKRKLENKEN